MSSNGVAPESPDPSTLTWVAVHARPASVRRARDGYWSLTLDVEYQATLPDGRILTFRAQVDVPGKQSGKPPGRPRKAKSHANH